VTILDRVPAERIEEPTMTTENTTPPTTPTTSAAPPPPKHRRGRAKNPYRHAERPKAPLMMTVPEAAETLRTTVDALRARLRRAQVVGADGSVTAPLGPGIVGMKVGANTWRVRFDAK
jgi:hypothetical protein